MKQVGFLAGLALLALLPVIPLLLFGYGGHDLLLHVPTWLELSDLWRAGYIWSGWSPGASYGLGEPTFCYYPPVSLVAGAALAMILPFRFVPAAFVWLTVLLSGISMYFASRGFVAPADRWKAAVLYMASPYLITTLLVRYAAAEALTLAWLPLLIVCFYRSIVGGKFRDTLWLSLFLALTWVANVPASIILFYALGAVALVRAVGSRSWRPALMLGLANCLAAALAAFYLVPTWAEQAWIAKTQVLRFDYSPFFLFASMFQPPLRFFRIGLTATACVGAITIALCAWAGYRATPNPAETGKEPARDQFWTWAGIAAVCLLFQLSLSAPLWKVLPQLMFAGFPYRFLAPIGVVLPLAALSKYVPRHWRILGYLATALLVALPLKQFEPYLSLAQIRPLVEQEHRFGYGSWPEFTPAGATRFESPVDFPPGAVVDPAGNPECHVRVVSKKPEETVLETDAAKPCQARVALFFYPFWRAADDSGTPLRIEKNSIGLMLVAVPQGKHTIRLEFHATSLPRTASLAVSLAALFLAMVGLVRPPAESRPKRNRQPLPAGAVSS